MKRKKTQKHIKYIQQVKKAAHKENQTHQKWNF